MLHAIAQLAQNDVRNIERILADEINADAFRTNQSHHLLDFFFDRLFDVGEEQMRFIEKENELRFFRIADFRKLFEKLGEQPEQETSRKLSATAASTFPRREC